MLFRSALLVDTTGDGAIVLRPAAIYPVEIHRDEPVELLPTLSMTAASAGNATWLTAVSCDAYRHN